MKFCPGCKKIKSENNFTHALKKWKPDGFRTYCKSCQKIKYDEVRKVNRIEVLKHYGAFCNCCNETIVEFLTIDHIEGYGNKHRELIKRRGNGFYKWLIDNNFPNNPPLRILCWNCNRCMGTYGYCPHQNSPQE